MKLFKINKFFINTISIIIIFSLVFGLCFNTCAYADVQDQNASAEQSNVSSASDSDNPEQFYDNVYVKNYRGTFKWYGDDDKKYTNNRGEINFGFELLFNTPEDVYCRDIATTACMMSNTAYYKGGSKADLNGCYFEPESGPKTNDRDLNLYYALGFDNVKKIDISSPNTYYESNDKTSIYLAKAVARDPKTSELKNIYVCTVRGTNGTIEEWTSNYDIGSYDANNANGHQDYWAANSPNWKDKNNHKGFDVTANLVKDELYKFIDESVSVCSPHSDNVSDYLLITGHSRGGSIANLVGQKVIDDKNSGKYLDNRTLHPFTYTFAAPATTSSESYNNNCYDSIFNIVNLEDIVPCSPFECWGFHLYGKVFYGRGSREGTWMAIQHYTGWDDKGDYDCYSAKSKYELIEVAKKIATNRQQLYAIPTKGGLNSDAIYSKKNTHGSSIVQSIINLGYDKFCRWEIDEGSIEDTVTIYPSPAFMLCVMSHLCCGGSSFLSDYTIGGYIDKLIGPLVGSRNKFNERNKEKEDYLAISLRGSYSSFFNEFTKDSVIDGYSDGHLPVIYYSICVSDLLGP